MHEVAFSLQLGKDSDASLWSTTQTMLRIAPRHRTARPRGVTKRAVVSKRWTVVREHRVSWMGTEQRMPASDKTNALGGLAGA